jgi:hypothetical protein
LVDLGYGTDDYKYRLGLKEYELVDIEIFDRGERLDCE